MIKKWCLTLICVLMLALLAGCASNADNMPMTSPSAMPQTTEPVTTVMPTVMQPSQTALPAQETAAIGSSAEAMRIADAIEEELDRLSEVDDAKVFVFGNVALVGLEYDDQYQGGMTDRIKEMVEERIKTVHTGIENVYVTDDPVQVKAIEGLKDALKAGETAFDEVAGKAQQIVDDLTGSENNSASGTAAT